MILWNSLPSPGIYSTKHRKFFLWVNITEGNKYRANSDTKPFIELQFVAGRDNKLTNKWSVIVCWYSHFIQRKNESTCFTLIVLFKDVEMGQSNNPETNQIRNVRHQLTPVTDNRTKQNQNHTAGSIKWTYRIILAYYTTSTWVFIT